jgi:hypothetical protein
LGCEEVASITGVAFAFEVVLAASFGVVVALLPAMDILCFFSALFFLSGDIFFVDSKNVEGPRFFPLSGFGVYPPVMRSIAAVSTL